MVAEDVGKGSGSEAVVGEIVRGGKDSVGDNKESERRAVSEIDGDGGGGGKKGGELSKIRERRENRGDVDGENGW